MIAIVIKVLAVAEFVTLLQGWFCSLRRMERKRFSSSSLPSSPESQWLFESVWKASMLRWV